MKIAVVGTGNVGGVLGRRWAQGGHQVTFGTRDPSSAKVADLLASAGSNASAASTSEAVAASDVVVLTTPWDAARQIIESIGDWDGKTLVDCTNPIAPGFELAVGTTTSGGELVAVWAKGARVVKAFNTTGFENMADPTYDGAASAMFICGDDAEAKATVTQLAEELGFEVADTGGLKTARYLEPLAMVWILLAMRQGWGRNFAFKLVKRQEPR